MSLKCVVTGGSGFIGSHVVEALRKAGHRVTNIDLKDIMPADHYFNVDIRDSARLAEVFSQHGQDAVFHLAAIANARAALDDPVTAVDINIRGTASVLEAARKSGVKRVVLASTVWYYNAVDQTVDPKKVARGEVRYLDENEPLLPQGGGHVYTTSKVASEFLCHDFQRLYGLHFTILRYGIPYGPRMWPGLALRAFVDNSVAGQPIKIFGDGSMVRRFLYVGDLAQAHVLALSEAAKDQTYNIEGLRDVTIKELAESVAKFVPNVKIEYVIDPTRRGELKLDGIAISNKKAKDEMGWAPVTDLEDGVRRYVEWYKKENGAA